MLYGLIVKLKKNALRVLLKSVFAVEIFSSVV